MTLGVLQQMESGSPYGAVGSMRQQDYVTDPGYLRPPDTVNYFFTVATRSAPRRCSAPIWRSTHAPAARSRRDVRAVPAAECVQPVPVVQHLSDAINTTVLTAVDDPARFQPFNPFTQTPVKGVHWDYGTVRQGHGADAYTLPRTFQFAVGVSF